MNKYAHTRTIIEVWIGWTIIVVTGGMFDVIENICGYNPILKRIRYGGIVCSISVGIFSLGLRKSFAPRRLKFTGNRKEPTEILIFQMNLKLENKIGDYYMFRETHRFLPDIYVQVSEIEEGFELIVYDPARWLIGGLLELENFEVYCKDRKDSEKKVKGL